MTEPKPEIKYIPNTENPSERTFGKPIGSTPGGPLFNWRLDVLAIALLFAVALGFVIPPLFSPGIVNPNDFLMSVHRTMTLDEEVRLGIYFPRFGADFNFGYGAPLFQFYPPLASYIGLGLVWLGVGYITATKSVMAIALLAGTIGTYVYGRYLLRNQIAALAAAFCFLLAPYFLLILYERGAVAEIVAWGILPWLIWALHRWYQNGRIADGVLASLLVALVMLAHNATALFIIPGAALLLVLLALIERRADRIVAILFPVVIGAGLSAFYWLPAMLEIGLTRSDEFMFSGATAVEGNVVAWRNIVQSTPLAQYQGVERFRIALWHFVLGTVAIVMLILQRRRRPAMLALLAAVWVAVLLLQTQWSLVFWDHAPYVRMIQFPWRLHGIGVFCTALLVGGVLMDVRPVHARTRVLAVVSVGALALLPLWLSMTNALPERSALWMQLGEEEITRSSMWERGFHKYALWEDYTLKTVTAGATGYAEPRAADDPGRLPGTTSPEMTILRYNPERLLLAVNAPEEWTLRLHRAWYPGWRVWADNVEIETAAVGSGGIVSAEMPAGVYTVEARFGMSPLRLLANIISLVSAGVVVAWMIRPRPIWQGALVSLLVALVLGGGIRLATVELRPGVTPNPWRADFDNGLSLLGFRLSEPTLCRGDAMELQTWWHVTRTPDSDAKFFVHAIVLDDSAQVAQFDAFPSDGYNHMTRWEPGEIVPQSIRIRMDAEIPSGHYALVMGIYDPETVTNLTVLRAPELLPGDRLRLAEFDVVDCRD